MIRAVTIFARLAGFVAEETIHALTVSHPALVRLYFMNIEKDETYLVLMPRILERLGRI